MTSANRTHFERPPSPSFTLTILPFQLFNVSHLNSYHLSIAPFFGRAKLIPPSHDEALLFRIAASSCGDHSRAPQAARLAIRVAYEMLFFPTVHRHESVSRALIWDSWLRVRRRRQEASTAGFDAEDCVSFLSVGITVVLWLCINGATTSLVVGTSRVVEVLVTGLIHRWCCILNVFCPPLRISVRTRCLLLPTSAIRFLQ
jgi:hypothetical protein